MATGHSQTIRDHFSWRHSAEQAVRTLQSVGFFQWQNIFDNQFANMADPKMASCNENVMISDPLS